MTDIHKILSAKRPMTLAGAPAGFLPWLAADLARAAKGRAVFIAPDEAAMRHLQDAAAYFAPELEVLAFPAWDCLPYDRASPSLRASSERLATLHALQRKTDKPQLLVTTVNAATQRTLTPFRVRQLVARLAPGERIDMAKLSALLSANGYHRTDTVQDAGEYAVRGGIVDLFPAGESEGLRLDFFGDEIESVRRFDPATQRTSGDERGGFTLLPASETLLDEDSVRRFRSRYRERFGATATGDPIYQAVSEGRRLAGIDHWLPLFEERLDTLFDHLGENDIVVRDAHDSGAADARFEAIADYYENRKRAQSSDPGSYRPLEPETLYLPREEWERLIEERPLHLATPFHEPESARVIDFEVDSARDFAPERSQNVNVYEAVVEHVSALRKAGKKVVLASYSAGARERLKGLLGDHGLKKAVEAETWQEALGASSPLPGREGPGVGPPKAAETPGQRKSRCARLPTPIPSLPGRGVSQHPDPRLRPPAPQHQLGHRIDHRVGAVGRSARPFVAAADGEPGQLVLQRREGAGELRRAALEQRRHRLGPGGLAAPGEDQLDRQVDVGGAKDARHQRPALIALGDDPVGAPPLRRPRDHPRPAVGAEPGNAAVGDDMGAIVRRERAHHDPAGVAVGGDRRIDPDHDPLELPPHREMGRGTMRSMVEG